MKIAIFHDYFDEIGGAEITLLIIARELDATIFTTNINFKKIKNLGFSNIKIKTIGNIPKITPLKQIIAGFRFSRVRIKGFDHYIFGRSYSIFAAKRHKPGTWYVNSVPRGLHEKKYGKNIITLLRKYIDKRNVKNIKRIISNSKGTQSKIKEYYGRKSKIIYHPINVSSYKYKKDKGFWLSITRIDPYKKIELQLKTFSCLPNEKLIIIGEANLSNNDYFRMLRVKAPSNVLFIGGIYDMKKIRQFYSECKGFIVTARDEDFGMTPVEAMASGKPVVAVNEGGYKESIINGKTGILTYADPQSLADAVYKINKNPRKYKEDCIKQARKFDKDIFIFNLKKELGINF